MGEPPNKDLVLALKRAIEAKFDGSDWDELGLITGTSEYLNGHPRLLRSLRFGDDDYGACIVEVLPQVVGVDLEHLDDVVEFVDLEAWLREHEPKLHDRLFGGGLKLSPEDLTALTDPAVIVRHLLRLQASIDTDPEHAIGVAKELVESTVKLVLQQLEVEFDPAADVPQLAKQAQQALGLHPGVLSPNARGLDASKKVLAGLTQIAIGIAELRNLYGTGHGRTAPTSGIKPRHAWMAVDAATTYCRALLATLADSEAPWRSDTRRPPTLD